MEMSYLLKDEGVFKSLEQCSSVIRLRSDFDLENTQNRSFYSSKAIKLNLNVNDADGV